MARLLYIESSPRKDRSHSIKVAASFIDEYKKSHPGDTVDTIDLWNPDNALPRFDGDIINAKYNILHGEDHTEEEREAWRAVEKVIYDFIDADKYVISLPMWNFSIPYMLKQYIDVLVQPGYSFTYSPEKGYEGTVTGKPVMLIYARGGAYGPGSGGESLDYQKTYMEQILGFIGFKDIRSILVEPTLMLSPEEKEKLDEEKAEEARKLAREY